MADFYSSQVGEAIVTNSANMFLLGQKPETIDQLKAAGRLVLSGFGTEVLKTVHTVPGSSSEIYVRTDRGEGVGRLIVSEFNRLLYSTRPADRAAVNEFRRQGLPIVEAIHAVLKDRREAGQRPATGRKMAAE